jgi:hypothetical protein
MATESYRGMPGMRVCGRTIVPLSSSAVQFELMDAFAGIDVAYAKGNGFLSASRSGMARF